MTEIEKLKAEMQRRHAELWVQGQQPPVFLKTCPFVTDEPVGGGNG